MLQEMLESSAKTLCQRLASEVSSKKPEAYNRGWRTLLIGYGSPSCHHGEAKSAAAAFSSPSHVVAALAAHGGPLTAPSQAQVGVAAAWPAVQMPGMPPAAPAAAITHATRVELCGGVKAGKHSFICRVTPAFKRQETTTLQQVLQEKVPCPPLTSSLGSPGWRRSEASRVAMMLSLAFKLRSCGQAAAQQHDKISSARVNVQASQHSFLCWQVCMPSRQQLLSVHAIALLTFSRATSCTAVCMLSEGGGTAASAPCRSLLDVCSAAHERQAALCLGSNARETASCVWPVV